MQYTPLTEPVFVEAPRVENESLPGAALHLWFQPGPVVIHIVESMVAYGAIPATR